MSLAHLLASFSLLACTATPQISDDDPEPDAGLAETPRAPFTTGLSTLGGWDTPGYLDGRREVNLFSNPVNVAFGPDGRLYVADFDNNKLRVLDMTGMAETVVTLPRPFGLAFIGSTLYVQTDNDPANAHSTLTGTIWRVDVTGKVATPIASNIGRPRGLAALQDGRLALADYMHHVVQVLDPTTGALTPLAGAWDSPGLADASGADARFAAPYGIAQRPDGALILADHDNHRLRVVQLDGTVTTLAGSVPGYQDGALATATFTNPQGVAIAASGDVFVTDLGNYRVRRIDGDEVATVAGNGAATYADNDNPQAGSLYGLEGLSVSPDGTRVFVADGTRGEEQPSHRVRVIARKP